MTERVRRDTRSSSVALGVVFASLLLVGIAFAGVFIAFANEKTFLREANAAIEADLRAARLAMENDLDGINRWLETTLKTSGESFLYALKRTGMTSGEIAGNLPEWPQADVRSIQPGLIEFPYQRDGAERVGIARLLTLTSGGVLLVGRDVTDLMFIRWFAQSFGWVMIGVFLAFAVASVMVGLYVANRMNRIADIADRIIDTGDLASRVPVDSSWDDLSKLSAVLNRLLEQLECNIHGIKSVSDSIAHDLRTPLTRLRGKLEDLPDSDQKVAVIAELDNSLSIFTSLLRITAIETEKRKSDFELLDLKPLLSDVVDLYEPMLEDKAVSIDVATVSAQLKGDRNLLFQLFANLLDNAVKFTPSGGEIRIRSSIEGGHVSVSICDSGPGIPEAEREKVMLRFYRLDKSRHESGNGLGLAVVSAVVGLHSGTISLRDGESGTGLRGLCCDVRLPLNSQ